MIEQSYLLPSHLLIDETRSVTRQYRFVCHFYFYSNDNRIQLVYMFSENWYSAVGFVLENIFRVALVDLTGEKKNQVILHVEHLTNSEELISYPFYQLVVGTFRAYIFSTV